MATSRLLKARSLVCVSRRFLTSNLVCLQPNNKIFIPTILRGKSMLSQPVPHMTINSYLDFFENEDVFQIKQEAFLRKPFDVLPVNYAMHRCVISIPEITTDTKDSVAKKRKSDRDVVKLINIKIEAEVSRTKLLKEPCTKTVPQNSIDEDAVKKMSQDEKNIKIAENKEENAYVKTIPLNITDTKDIESRIGQNSKVNETADIERKIELYSTNFFKRSPTRKVPNNNNKTTDSNRKAALLNARLLKDAHVKNMAQTSYRTEPNVKMNCKKTVDSKSLAELFNVALRKETYNLMMAQNFYKTEPYVKTEEHMKGKQIIDSKSLARLFNAGLLKEIYPNIMPQKTSSTKPKIGEERIADRGIEVVSSKSMVINSIKTVSIDKTEQLNRDDKKTKENRSLADIFNGNIPKDNVKIVTPNASKTEPSAKTGHRNMDCNKTVDNKIKGNFNIGETYVKNTPQTSMNNKDKDRNVDQGCTR